jgi:hypothetical protein
MRLGMLVGTAVAMLALQGCAETTPNLGKRGQPSQTSVQWFNPDGSPRFVAYVACTSEDESCSTANKAFSEWADDRHVELRLIESDDAVFRSGTPSSGKAKTMPYRVVIRFVPLVVPSFSPFSGGSHVVGRYTPPKVGYRATTYVFDSATGSLLQETPAHKEVAANPDDHANRYIQSEVDDFLTSLDPAYSRK